MRSHPQAPRARVQFRYATEIAVARIELSNLNKSFGSVQAVKNLNFTIEDGEFVVFVGPSGCGKTTTLRMIAGFEDPTSGDIRIDGRTLRVLVEGRTPGGLDVAGTPGQPATPTQLGQPGLVGTCDRYTTVEFVGDNAWLDRFAQDPDWLARITHVSMDTSATVRPRRPHRSPGRRRGGGPLPPDGPGQPGGHRVPAGAGLGAPRPGVRIPAGRPGIRNAPPRRGSPLRTSLTPA